MLKSIIHFFRSRKIKKNLQYDRIPQFPDLQMNPTVTIFVDDNQKCSIKGMENLVKESMKPKRIRFVILTEFVKDDFLQSDTMFFIEKNDFTKLGVLKKEKETILKSFQDMILINLSNNDENLLNDYIVSCIDSKFKVGHSNTNMKLHDLIIDYGIEKNDIERLKILFKYLLMLSGNTNEE